MNEDVLFRKMTVADVNAVFEIEYSSFTLPWTKEAFHYEMTENKHAYYVLAETSDGIIGFCGLWIVMDECHVTNIAIRKEQRGKKWGEKLMLAAMTTAQENGAKTMTLEARVSNTIARNLYEKIGFKNGGIRKSYYSDNLEDAIVMWVNFDE